VTTKPAVLAIRITTKKTETSVFCILLSFIDTKENLGIIKVCGEKKESQLIFTYVVELQADVTSGRKKNVKKVFAFLLLQRLPLSQ